MMLYVNGDSHSAGTDLKDISQAWPTILSNKLNLNVINESKPGGSNPRILRTTGNFTTHAKDIFVVIGWTSWEREEWYVDNKYYDVNAGGHDPLPEKLIARYKSWVIKQDEEQRRCKSEIAHDQIYKLHCQYKDRKIPHLFFNALMPFTPCTQKVDWHNNYFGPYENESSYYWHLTKAGFISNEFYHHSELAQSYWANVLYEYIIQKNIL